jgi:hypothetical protein
MLLRTALPAHRQWMSSFWEITAFTGGHTLNNLVYIGFSLIGFGFAFFLYLILIDKPEPDDDDEIN